MIAIAEVAHMRQLAAVAELPGGTSVTLISRTAAMASIVMCERSVKEWDEPIPASVSRQGISEELQTL